MKKYTTTTTTTMTRNKRPARQGQQRQQQPIQPQWRQPQQQDNHNQLCRQQNQRQPRWKKPSLAHPCFKPPCNIPVDNFHMWVIGWGRVSSSVWCLSIDLLLVKAASIEHPLICISSFKSYARFMDFFAANVFLIILHATKLTQRGLNRFNDHAIITSHPVAISNICQ